MGLGLIRMRQGRPISYRTPEEAAAHRYTPGELDEIRRYRRAQVLGDAEGVRDGSWASPSDGRDEVMVMTSVHDATASGLRSYERIAAALARDARPAGAGTAAA